MAVGLTGGTLLGLIAGYLEGRIGLAIMAAMDLMLALPAILLAITIAASSRPGSGLAMIAAGLTGLPALCPPARGSALAVKRREFVEAAESLWGKSLADHAPPRVAEHPHPADHPGDDRCRQRDPPCSRACHFGLGRNRRRGRMLSDAQRYILSSPHIGIFPGLAIALDGDRLQPRRRRPPRRSRANRQAVVV